MTMYLSLFGILLCALTGIFTALFHNDGVFRCYVMPAGFAVAFWAAFGILGLKTWRTHKIFEKTVQLESWSMSNSMLGMILCVPVVFDMILLAIWFLIGVSF